MAFDKRCCCIIIAVIAALAIIIFILLIAKFIINNKKKGNVKTKGGLQTTGFKYLVNYNEEDENQTDYIYYRDKPKRMKVYNAIDILSSLLLEYESKFRYFTAEKFNTEFNSTYITRMFNAYSKTSRDDNYKIEEDVNDQINKYQEFRKLIVPADINDSNFSYKYSILLNIIPTLIDFIFLSKTFKFGFDFSKYTWKINSYIISFNHQNLDYYTHMLCNNVSEDKNDDVYDDVYKAIKICLNNYNTLREYFPEIKDSRMNITKDAEEIKYTNINIVTKLPLKTLWFNVVKYNSFDESYYDQIKNNVKLYNKLVKFVVNLSKDMYEKNIMYNNWNPYSLELILSTNNDLSTVKFVLKDFNITTIVDKYEKMITKLNDNSENTYNKILNIIQHLHNGSINDIQKNIPCLVAYLYKILENDFTISDDIIVDEIEKLISNELFYDDERNNNSFMNIDVKNDCPDRLCETNKLYQLVYRIFVKYIYISDFKFEYDNNKTITNITDCKMTYDENDIDDIQKDNLIKYLVNKKLNIDDIENNLCLIDIGDEYVSNVVLFDIKRIKEEKNKNRNSAPPNIINIEVNAGSGKLKDKTTFTKNNGENLEDAIKMELETRYPTFESLGNNSNGNHTIDVYDLNIRDGKKYKITINYEIIDTSTGDGASGGRYTVDKITFTTPSDVDQCITEFVNLVKKVPKQLTVKDDSKDLMEIFNDNALTSYLRVILLSGSSNDNHVMLYGGFSIERDGDGKISSIVENISPIYNVYKDFDCNNEETNLKTYMDEKVFKPKVVTEYLCIIKDKDKSIVAIGFMDNSTDDIGSFITNITTNVI